MTGPAPASRPTGDLDDLDDLDRRFLRQAFADAERAGRAGERPFAGIVVSAGRRVLASAVNRQASTGDFIRHAELDALRQASLRHPDRVPGSTLYASSEPCAMCSAGAFFVGIDRVVFGVGGPATYALMPRPGRQLSLPTAAVLGSGDRTTAVTGPALESEGVARLRAALAPGGSLAEAMTSSEHDPDRTWERLDAPREPGRPKGKP